MHFSPYYKLKNWQRLFGGIFIGAILSYLVFIYMNGQLIEKRIEENLRLRTEKQELQISHRMLEENMSELNEMYEQKLLIHSVKIVITNAEVYKLDRFSLHELNDQVYDQVNTIIGREVKSFTNHYPLLIRSVENKAYKINDFTYQARVKHLFINEQSQIHIELVMKR